jgi:hypothetical protein
MLPADHDGVATAQASIETDLEPNPFATAERPTLVIDGDVVFAPGRKAVALFLLRTIDVGSRINLDQLGLLGPAKQSAQRIEEMPRLRRCILTTVAASFNRGTGDLGVGLLASGCDDLFENIFPLPPRRQREISPRVSLAIALNQPRHRTNRRCFWIDDRGRIGKRGNGSMVFRPEFITPKQRPQTNPGAMAATDIPEHFAAGGFLVQARRARARH